MYNRRNLLDCLSSLFSIFLLPELNPKMAYLGPIFPPNCLPWEKDCCIALIPFIMLCLVIVDRESALFFFLHYDFFFRSPLSFFLAVFAYLLLCTGQLGNRVTNYCCSIDFPGSFGTLKVYNTTEAFGIVHLCIFKTFCTLAKIVSCQFVPQKHGVSPHFSNRTILSSGSACNGTH